MHALSVRYQASKNSDKQLHNTHAMRVDADATRIRSESTEHLVKDDSYTNISYLQTIEENPYCETSTIDKQDKHKSESCHKETEINPLYVIQSAKMNRSESLNVLYDGYINQSLEPRDDETTNSTNPIYDDVSDDATKSAQHCEVYASIDDYRHIL